MSAPIKLLATDAEDLAVISACLQDAILPISEMCFEPAARRFVAVVNRFKWEAAERARADGGLQADDDHLFPYERTQCGVRFEGVAAVKVRGINLKDRGQMLELLNIEAAAGGVLLTFSGGGALRLEAGDWRCTVEDLGEPWPTACRPCHGLDAAEDEAAA
jgi:hypothetical protein